MAERRLLQLTGSNEINPTFDLPSREIFQHGQKDITVVGPFGKLEKEAAAVHAGYWD
ncbi:cytosine deaminase [Agrilactobacillus composti DSM 18527 = JCM 14202]|nr:cytosine deaminase [Agrilactobacillus composti DSM 18527 = JCM 14202]